MEPTDPELTPLDELFLERAEELAARAIGNTAPNPPVGAVLVRDGAIAGEGYHHRAGDAHAEIHALRQAGERARGATLYVSLEPCAHVGRTPPCTPALLAAGVVRVVAGTADPTGHGGAGELRDGGVEVTVSGDPGALDLIDIFAGAYALQRPYLALKMAVSLDGAISSRPGVREQLTGEMFRRRVRELRVAYDAVMVGAGTIRIDDPMLTVRPAHRRLRPYARIVACERAPIDPNSRVLDIEQGYAKTIILAPGALAARLDDLRGKAEIVAVGPPESECLDLAAALRALRDRGIYSVLCEGGPTLAGRLIENDLADRFYWAIAPRLLRTPTQLQFERVERVGHDVLLAGRFVHV